MTLTNAGTDHAIEVAWRSPGLLEEDLDAYLADAVRSDSMLTAETMQIAAPAWRGTFAPEADAPPVSSWASDPAVARSFGHRVRLRTTPMHVLAIVVHRDQADEPGWVEYLVRAER